MGLLNQLSSFRESYHISSIWSIGYTLNITFIISRHRCGLVAVKPAKNERDSKDKINPFAISKFSKTETLTNGDLVTPITGVTQPHQPHQQQRVNRGQFWACCKWLTKLWIWSLCVVFIRLSLTLVEITASLTSLRHIHASVTYTNIGTDYGLSPAVRCQAIIWTIAGLFSIGT